MPITLPPLSRRRFLSRALLAGAATALSPNVWGADEVGQEVWALLADTHIAADRSAESRGVNMAANLRAVGTELVDLLETPEGVFIAGDLAFSSGETKDYEGLIALLEPIRQAGMPVHLALGNHDHRERFWDALPKERRTTAPAKQISVVRGHRANWFVLDSLETTLSTPGLLGSEQLQWLEKSLDARLNRPAIVMVHHNPGVREDITGLKDTEELLRLLRPRRHVKALIFGHTHRWTLSRDESGLHLINLPPVAYVFRSGMPSGWVKATMQKSGALLELRCIDPAHPSHGQVKELVWRD